MDSCSKTKIFHNLRSSAPLPPPSQPLSITVYAVSLLRSNPTFSPSTIKFLIDSATGNRVSYADFIHRGLTISEVVLGGDDGITGYDSRITIKKRIPKSGSTKLGINCVLVFSADLLKPPSGG
ncbi:hypothetical protein L1987_01199 [Smallanthus sonchifolius]|uniref:Uncharacterized protein n=1 Tax=Smallanthus sonchifolius TaxID=185202 RepID=A0ACB9K487_9ASTR|nr:hypothetical protein L1987_01199 [Smallanthus sonchifolius]